MSTRGGAGVRGFGNEKASLDRVGMAAGQLARCGRGSVHERTELGDSGAVAAASREVSTLVRKY
jgi:hypothetical protein